MDYSATSGSAAITADIDGASGDDGPNCPGASCEADSIATDVENLTGDGGGDTLTGSSQANVLDGQAGTDTLAGGGGTGADGADTFNGNTGTDTVTYATRTDALVVDVDGTADDGCRRLPLRRRL